VFDELGSLSEDRAVHKGIKMGVNGKSFSDKIFFIKKQILNLPIVEDMEDLMMPLVMLSVKWYS